MHEETEKMRKVHGAGASKSFGKEEEVILTQIVSHDSQNVKEMSTRLENY